MKLQRKTLVVAISGAFCYPVIGLAADAEADSVLKNVVVSASKIEQSTLEAPANVSVITSGEIEKSNNQRLGDALNAKVPGLYLRGGALGNARPGTTMLSSMRGQGGTLTKIAVLVDGMNMVDAYSGQVNWSMVSMEDVERVEVVPGVGSSLYGSNAMGGVISVTTKAPTKEEMSFKVGQGFGDSAGKYGSALYRNKFENGLGVVFGLSQNDRDGYVAEYVTKTPAGLPAAGAIAVNGAIPTTTITGTPTYIVGDKGLNASSAKNVHGKLYFDLSPTSKLNAGFAYSDNKSLGSKYESYLTNAATGNPVPISTAATNLSLNGLKTSIKESDFYGSIPMGNTALRYFAGYDGDLANNIKLSLNFGKIDRDSWNASAGTTAKLNSGAGTLSTSPNSTTNASAQMSMPVGDSQFLVIGLATEIGSLHQKQYATSNWTDMDSKTAELNKIDARSVTNSLFAQDQIAVGEKLTVYLGGRYDLWTAGGKGVVTAGSYPGIFDYPDRTESAFSPKLAGVYQLSDRLSVKSSIGTGFRAPTNYYLYANPTFSGAAAPNGKMIYSNPDLKPEKAKAFDLGTEYQFADGGNFKATYFITKTTDLIYQKVTKVPTYIDPVINKVIDYEAMQDNTGSALARGIELAGEYPLMRWLTVRGSYSYTDAKITSDLTNTGMKGKRVTNVPKNMMTVALDAQKGDWSSVLSARYVGEQFSNNDNSDTVKGVWTGYSKYTVFDLKASYRITKNLKANLMIDNLFDEEYYEYYRMPGRGVVVEIAGAF
jgi:iron complex outermembrane receptor protein